MKKNTEKTFCVKCNHIYGRTISITCYLEMGNAEYRLATEVWEEEAGGSGYFSRTPEVKAFSDICGDDSWFICDLLDMLRDKGKDGFIRIGANSGGIM